MTARTSVPIPPATVTGALPSGILPFTNDTLPAGPELPVTAFTVAVRRVVAFGAMFAGVAATVTVVMAGTEFTTTVTVPAELVKPVLPE